MADLTRESHFPPKAAFRLNSDLRVRTSLPWVIQATRTNCRLSSEANDLLENLGLNHLLDQETSGASSTLPAPSVLSTGRYSLPGAPRLPTRTLCKDAGACLAPPLWKAQLGTPAWQSIPLLEQAKQGGRGRSRRSVPTVSTSLRNFFQSLGRPSPTSHLTRSSHPSASSWAS